MQNIVTHAGTGTAIVRSVVNDAGKNLRVVSSPEDARAVPMDGLILLGGADVDPFYYGENDEHASGIDYERDLIEWALVRRAMAAEVPILGICRGHQMMAVAAGGSLWQDIRTQTGVKHGWGNGHKLSGVDSPLAGHIPTWNVNSLHHQAVRTIPSGFKATAYSKDGLIESIWRPGALGVQWHPELMLRNDPRWLSIFQWFFNGLGA